MTTSIPKEDRCPACRGKGGRNKRCRACRHAAWTRCAACGGTGLRGDVSPAYVARKLQRLLYDLHGFERMLADNGEEVLPLRREYVAGLMAEYANLRAAVESWRRRLDPEVYAALFGAMQVEPLGLLTEEDPE